MDLGWILHGFVQIWAWIWEITYQLTLLEWRLAWYWAIYLPWAGFPNQFVRNSISKKGKFIDLRSNYGHFSAFSRSFNRSKIWLMFTPVFAMLRETHVDVYCDECDKRFSAKRNLRRHIKKKHEIQDDTLSDMVDRAELVIQNWELQNIILLTKGSSRIKYIYLLYMLI